MQVSGFRGLGCMRVLQGYPSQGTFDSSRLAVCGCPSHLQHSAQISLRAGAELRHAGGGLWAVMVRVSVLGLRVFLQPQTPQNGRL